MSAASLVDPWSRPIRYEADSGGYLLCASDESAAGVVVDRRGGR